MVEHTEKPDTEKPGGAPERTGSASGASSGASSATRRRRRTAHTPDAAAHAATAAPAAPGPQTAGLGKGMTMRVLLVQLVGYLCMAAMWFAPGVCTAYLSPSPWTALEAFVMLLLFTFTYPFPLRTPSTVAARVAAIAMGVGGVAFSSLDPLGVHWLRWVAALAAALVVGAFLYELLRSSRTRMIYSLSTTVMSGLVGLCGMGWCLLPQMHLWRICLQRNPLRAWCVVAGLVAAFVMLGWASVIWSRRISITDYVRVAVEPGRVIPGLRRVWLCWGLIPVLVFGAAVAVAAWFVVTA